MLNKHLCLVPALWSQYPSEFMGLVLHSEVGAHYRQTNKIKGTKVEIDDTVAVLQIHRKQIWMKLEKDNHHTPYTKTYVGIFMPCIKTTES